jgi:sulfonate transport system substrate-binding protein
MLSRRHFLAASAALPPVLTVPAARAASGLRNNTLTLGYQKTGIPLVARQLKVFEKRFEPLGIRVEWAEFTSGLTLLQAMDTGDVAFGNAGNVGCIFLQASGGRVVYVGAQPSPRKSEGILVKADSPIRSVADLKGRKVGYARGSSSHNYIAAALEQQGLDLGDIQSVSLGAADASFAFGGGNIDAWVTWDPYFSIAQAKNPTRVLGYHGDVLKHNAGFLLANAEFAKAYPAHVRALVEGSAEAGAWAKTHLDETTRALSAATGIPVDILTEVNRNAGFDVVPLDNAILDAQQATADRLQRLGVVPRRVNVRDIVWSDRG